MKIWSTEAQIDAAFLAPHFQAEGGQKTCILEYACIRGKGIISDRGIAACVGVDLLLATLELGAGTDWADPFGSATVFTGCDFGHWRTVVRPAQAAGPERRITIRPGMRAFSLAVVGRGRAPDVELRGPTPAGRSARSWRWCSRTASRATTSRSRASPPPPPKPGRPPRLRARRRGTSLVITWGSAAKAQSYEARVRLSDGRSLFFTRAARARSFTVRGVAKATRATVRVAGLRGRSRTGPAAVLRVSAVRPA